MVRIIRDSDGSRADACVRLARTLSAGFTETGLETMAAVLPTDRTFVAEADGDVVGYASLAANRSRVAHLSWFAVANQRQGEGIGTRLVETVDEDCAARGVRLVTVKTLADTVADENYELTRRFYDKEGFLHVDTMDPYLGLDPGNPCAIYVKPVPEAEHSD